MLRERNFGSDATARKILFYGYEKSQQRCGNLRNGGIAMALRADSDGPCNRVICFVFCTEIKVQKMEPRTAQKRGVCRMK